MSNDKNYVNISNEQFEVMLKKYIDEKFETLGIKAREYSRGNNRFHNFDVAVDILKYLGPIDTPAKVAFCFRVKHIVSIIDMLNNPETITEAMLKEKCGDDGNYGDLMRGILERELMRGEI